MVSEGGRERGRNATGTLIDKCHMKEEGEREREGENDG